MFSIQTFEINRSRTQNTLKVKLKGKDWENVVWWRHSPKRIKGCEGTQRGFIPSLLSSYRLQHSATRRANSNTDKNRAEQNESVWHTHSPPFYPNLLSSINEYTARNKQLSCVSPEKIIFTLTEKCKKRNKERKIADLHPRRSTLPRDVC